MKRFGQLLLSYGVYTVSSLVFCLVIYVLYRYGIVYNWGLEKGFLTTAFFSAFLLFFPLASSIGVFRALFIIRKHPARYGIQLLVLGICNIGLLLGSFYIVIPREISAEQQKVHSLPTNYLLNLKDGRSMFIQQSTVAEEGVVGESTTLKNIVVGDNLQVPYFSLYRNPVFDKESQNILVNGEEKEIVDVDINEILGPTHAMLTVPNIIRSVWDPVKHISTTLIRYRNTSFWQTLLFIVAITFFLLSLWNSVCMSTSYGYNIWFSLLSWWGILRLYQWLVTLLQSGSFPLQLSTFMQQILPGIILVPGFFFFIMYFLRLLGRENFQRA